MAQMKRRKVLTPLFNEQWVSTPAMRLLIITIVFVTVIIIQLIYGTLHAQTSLPTGYTSHACVVWFYTSYFVFRCFLSSSAFFLDIGPKCNSWKNLFDPLTLLMDRQGIVHQIIKY